MSPHFVLPLSFLALILIGCSLANQTIHNAAAEADLNVWWKGTFSRVQPEKPGTVTPAHSITIKGGHVLQIGKHVQTKEEYDEQLKDLLWEQHRRSGIAR
jgi:hypothetical protein